MTAGVHLLAIDQGTTSTRALVFPASPSGAQSLSTAAAVGALPCDAAVRFEVSPLDDAAGAGDLVLETRREPTGGIVTAWREVWRMSMSDLRAASADAARGEVVAAHG